MSTSTHEIWEDFRHQLRRYVIKKTSSPDDAQDVLQEIFLKVHTRVDTLRNGDLLGAWLFRIARNTVIDYYRSKRPGAPMPDTLATMPEPVETEPAKRIAAALRPMIDNLPEKYREVLLLTELEDLKQQEVSARLGLSLSAIKSRVRRGRDMLRTMLLECCHFEFDRRGHMIDYSPRPECCRCCRDEGMTEC